MPSHSTLDDTIGSNTGKSLPPFVVKLTSGKTASVSPALQIVNLDELGMFTSMHLIFVLSMVITSMYSNIQKEEMDQRAGSL